MTDKFHPGFGRQNGLRVLAFGLVLLGVCIFAWGLRYKLSLYYPPHSVGHRVQEAKLLPDRDKGAIPVVDNQQVVPNPSLYLVAPVLFLFVLPGARFWIGDRWQLARTRVRLSPGDARIPTVLNRPPPILL